MIRSFYFLVFTFLFSNLPAQPNCQAFLYLDKDTAKCEACKHLEQLEGLYQFSKAYQVICDEALAIDSTFAYAYNRKSTAYLKSGDFITWMRLTNKAVEYNPQEYLGHRGYLRYLCFRDYTGALRDFALLDSLGFGSERYSMAKALCHNALGDTETAIQLVEASVTQEGFTPGIYTYLHLGVLYLEQKRYKEAIVAFSKQSTVNEIAENQYYLALAQKALGTAYVETLERAKALYLAGDQMFSDYIDPIHKIYLENIEEALKGVTVE